MPSADAVVSTPNLFAYATSELSQDAVLCYWLAWGHHRYRSTHPRLHRLATALVARLTGSAAEVEEVEVHRQVDHIDVAVRVGNGHLIVIEDKTGTNEHSGQLERYRRVAETWKDAAGNPWGRERVRLAYVKTGNAPRAALPPGADVVVIGRQDLLALLNAATPMDDLILEQFRAHLAAWEAESGAFAVLPVSDGCSGWPTRAQEGFYSWLEAELGDGSWHHVSNPAGGFLGFYWHWRRVVAPACELYLQIEAAGRLQIRVGHAKDADGKDIVSSAAMRHQLLARLMTAYGRMPSPGFELVKSGRYKAGAYGAIVDVVFSGGGWIPCCQMGLLDRPSALERLRRVMAFVDAAAG